MHMSYASFAAFFAILQAVTNPSRFDIAVTKSFVLMLLLALYESKAAAEAVPALPACPNAVVSCALKAVILAAISPVTPYANVKVAAAS